MVNAHEQAARNAAKALAAQGDLAGAEARLLACPAPAGRHTARVGADLLTIRSRQGRSLETLALASRMVDDENVDGQLRLHVLRQIGAQWLEIGAHAEASRMASAVWGDMQRVGTTASARFAALELAYDTAEIAGEREARRALLPELRELLDHLEGDHMHSSGRAHYAAEHHRLAGDPHAALAAHRRMEPGRDLCSTGQVEWLVDRIELLIGAGKVAGARRRLRSLVEARETLLGPSLGASMRACAALELVNQAHRLGLEAEAELLLATHLAAVGDRILELAAAAPEDLHAPVARWLQGNELRSARWKPFAEERTRALLDTDDARLRDLLQPQGLITQCARCRRIASASGRWLPIGHWFYGDMDVLRFTHGYCKPCRDDILSTF